MPFSARCHIGLEQLVPVFFRPPDAVVADFDPHHVAFDMGTGNDTRVFDVGKSCHFQGFHRILDDVCQGLRDQAMIEIGGNRGLRQVDAQFDLRLPHAFEKDHMPDGVGKVGMVLGRRRHAGERGELVDHLADVTHLPDDRVGALVEDLEIILQPAAIAPAQAFGAQLDRGQRVLDLVGDAAGDIGPRTVALGRDQLAHVVERHHIALGLGHRAFARQPHLIDARIGGGAELDLVLHLTSPPLGAPAR